MNIKKEMEFSKTYLEDYIINIRFYLIIHTKANNEQPAKTKHCPLVRVSHLSIMMLILVLCIFINSKTTYSQNPLIVRVCENATDPPTCLSTLNSNSRCVTAKNMHDLAYAVVDDIQVVAVTTIDNIKTFLDESHGSLAIMLKNCKTEYESIYDKTKSLHESVVNEKKKAMSKVRSLAQSVKHHVNFCLSSIGASHYEMSIGNVVMARLAEILSIISSEKRP